MKVYKFGGASVRNSETIKNLANIVKHESNDLIIVISAIGKTTNALEKLTESYFTSDTGKLIETYDYIKGQHLRIFDALLKDAPQKRAKLINWFDKLKEKLNQRPSLNYDYEYDQIVPYGELFSTTLVHSYLESIGIESEWLDAREVLLTDSRYRSANIDWLSSESQFSNKISTNTKTITQGFIGANTQNESTTLGREGSDYTASVLAFLSNAEEVVIWKDVPGIMNADPKRFTEAELINTISFKEAIELAFYGAKVIHPKTIQPLRKKDIPLRVKSFIEPEREGTLIHNGEHTQIDSPIVIMKDNQVLISISHRDLSFIKEKQISQIYELFDKHRAHVNLSQNSAISFSASVDCDERHLPDLIGELKKHYVILYNTDVNMITIRHYSEESIDKLISHKEILLEQRSRKTAQFVVRDKL